SDKYDIKLPVGVSVKGHETTSTGLITSLHHPLIAQKTLRRDLQAVLNHSVLVASDGQCLAVAARSILQLDNKLTIFALSLDQSVCGGIIVSDKLLSGPHGLAGDWGHLSLPWPVDYELEGRICVCGRTGCLEHFVSLEGLSHDYELLTGNKLTAENIIKQAETGDIVAESAMQVIEDRISRGLAMVIGLLDPDIILIGGMLAKSERLFTNIPRKWPGYIRSSVNSDILVPLRTSNPCPDHLYLHGAAHLCDYAK
ncbi:MAG: ROK family protein, partial [Candidatus Puniceispirillaceae bacterium]